MTHHIESPIKITENAAQRLLELMKDAPAGTQGLRLGVKESGCSGHRYKMDYIPEGGDMASDERFEGPGGAVLYIPRTVSWMLFGMVIDFTQDEFGNAHFDFQNPNETARCGCGESFSVEKTDK